MVLCQAAIRILFEALALGADQKIDKFRCSLPLASQSAPILTRALELLKATLALVAF